MRKTSLKLIRPSLDGNLSTAELMQVNPELAVVAGAFYHDDVGADDRRDVGGEFGHVVALDVHCLAAMEPAALVQQFSVLDPRLHHVVHVVTAGVAHHGVHRVAVHHRRVLRVVAHVVAGDAGLAARDQL